MGGWISLEAEVSYAAPALEPAKAHHNPGGLRGSRKFQVNLCGLRRVGVGGCRRHPCGWAGNGPVPEALGWFHPQVWEKEEVVEIVLKIHFNYRRENEDGEWLSPLPVLYVHKELTVHTARNQSKIFVHQTAGNSADFHRHDPRLRREPSEPHLAPSIFCNLTSSVSNPIKL